MFGLVNLMTFEQWRKDSTDFNDLFPDLQWNKNHASIRGRE